MYQYQVILLISRIFYIVGFSLNIPLFLYKSGEKNQISTLKSESKQKKKRKSRKKSLNDQRTDFSFQTKDGLIPIGRKLWHYYQLSRPGTSYDTILLKIWVSINQLFFFPSTSLILFYKVICNHNRKTRKNRGVILLKC